MKMKRVYIAHPIGGDVEKNLQKVAAIVRKINLESPGIIPMVPYYVYCVALDDDNPIERERGMQNNRQYFSQGMIDELWLFGPKISKGMKHEIKLAEIFHIPVVPQTQATQNQYDLVINSEE